MKEKSEVIHALKQAFEPPEPERKRSFLRTLPRGRISSFSFMAAQAGYIRKWVWALSFLLLGAAFAGAVCMKKETLWLVSGMLPFAAMAAVTENFRSLIYGMGELEMASRFSFRSVVLARMGILGAGHISLFVILIPVICFFSTYTLLQTGVYLLVPYLLTTVSCLWITRKIGSRDAMYACTGAAICVSGLTFFIRMMMASLLQIQYLSGWIGVLAILAALSLREGKKVIRQAV